MKLSYSRRYRRSSSRSRENKMFNKDNQHEHTFFSAPSNDSFFKPKNTIMRKCDHCAAEDKKVSKMNDSKEEEKNLHKMDEKKEEDKAIHKMDEKKEEKPIMKMEEKKEEDKAIHKMEEKREEKPIMKMDDKKEDDKSLQKMEEKKEEKEVHKMEDNKEEKKVAVKQDRAKSSPAQASDYIHSLDGKGNSLPDHTKQFFNKRFGYDFSSVKIHNGIQAEQSAKELSAKAYAVDHNIVFNKGQYNPGTAEGDKLLAHELVHIIQNKKARKINRKEQHPEEEKEKSVTISGSANKAKNKSSYGNCQGVQVQGRTDFNPVPSSFSVQGGTTRPSKACEECTAPDCITARGIIVSVFRSNPTISLPPVPDGLTPCETAAVRRFINTTLLNHEQQHFRAFKTYDGVVRTRLNYTGCQSDLDGHVQSIHDNIDAQRSNDAIAKSDALDPFVRPIPCNCE